MIITIHAKNISKGEIKTILSAWLAVIKIFFVKALINLPFGRNPTYKFNKQWIQRLTCFRHWNISQNSARKKVVGRGEDFSTKNLTGWSCRCKSVKWQRLIIGYRYNIKVDYFQGNYVCSRKFSVHTHALFWVQTPLPLRKKDHCLTSTQTAAANWWRIVFGVSGSRFFNMADLQWHSSLSLWSTFVFTPEALWEVALYQGNKVKNLLILISW